MSDLLVDGVPYDVYTPKTGNLDRIASAIADKAEQVNGGGVVVDLRQSPARDIDVDKLLYRVRMVTKRITNIIILED
jgi:filamentous hemagglutinin